MADKTTESEVNTEETKSPEAPAAQSKEEETQAAPVQKRTASEVTAFRALMDREKALRGREQKLQQLERELEQYKQLPKIAKERPLDAIRALGVDYEDLVKRVSKGERADPVDPIRQEMMELKAQLQELRQREQEAERMTAAERAKKGIHEFVAESEEYPLTRHFDGGSDMVFDYVQDHYNTTGEWLSEADAAREVEAYLSGLVEKAMELDSIKQKFLSPQKKPTETPHISNEDASSIASRDPSGRASVEDRIAQAAKVLEAGMRERS